MVLIEDGSPDNALEICQALASEHDKVRLLRHPNGENRGAGASRNLGMRNAKFDYIAFLDADDFFLPGRFSVASAIFDENPACEGVYEAIGMYVEDKEGWEQWLASGKPLERIKTIKESIKPSDLGIALIEGGKGHFSLDGFVIKRSVLEKSGNMDESLRIHQDTNFIIRAALTAKLLPGSITEPVTMWRVHQANRVSSPKSKIEKMQDRMSFLYSTYCWAKMNKQKNAKNLLVKELFSHMASINEGEVQNLNKLNRVVKRFNQVSNCVRTHNEMLLEPQFWKSLLLFVFSAGGRI